MSKPNLLAFSSSVGIYRNKRVLDLKRFLRKKVPVKTTIADMAPMLFQVVMSYAAENQIDGNFSDYEPEDWQFIFASNDIHLTPKQAADVVYGFVQVGLFEKGKIRSWLKYNRHLADYEGIVKARRRAGKLSAKRREQEAKELLQNSSTNGQISAQNEQNSASKTVQKTGRKAGAKSDPDSKQIWLLNQAIEQAKSPKTRRALEKQKAKVLSGLTGIDLDAPAAQQAEQAQELGIKPVDWERASYNLAKTTLEDFPEGLTASMIETLLSSGVNPASLPPSVRSAHKSTIAALRNPVPT